MLKRADWRTFQDLAEDASELDDPQLELPFD